MTFELTTLTWNQIWRLISNILWHFYLGSTETSFQYRSHVIVSSRSNPHQFMIDHVIDTYTDTQHIHTQAQVLIKSYFSSSLWHSFFHVVQFIYSFTLRSREREGPVHYQYQQGSSSSQGLGHRLKFWWQGLGWCRVASSVVTVVLAAAVTMARATPSCRNHPAPGTRPRWHNPGYHGTALPMS